MQTKINEYYINTPLGMQADEILRRCVHCGFCNATCPTYQLTGDELDGPRGRIYQIKQVLETQQASAKIQLHLDRCLTCLNCETTCPSGVKYGQLLDIGRQLVDDKVKRPLRVRIMRVAVTTIVPYTGRVKLLLNSLKWFKWVLPKYARGYFPNNNQSNLQSADTQSDTQGIVQPGNKPHKRKVLLLQGCVQPALAPEINTALARLLTRMGISVIPTNTTGCCGALSYHLSNHSQAQGFMRKNIDAWWRHIEDGAESIITTASACSLFLKDYERLLADDAQYASKAKRISAMCQDVSELIHSDDLPFNYSRYRGKKIAFQSPCTLQHGLGVKGKVETLLQDMGMTVLPIVDAHLCCGAAGTYSIFQKGLSDTLRGNKIRSLQHPDPDIIATANIGCLLQLKAVSSVPVKHWIELLAE